MSQKVVCAYCGEPIEGEAVQKGPNLYCSQACAYEGSRSKDCAGRTDASRASLQEEMAFRENPPTS